MERLHENKIRIEHYELYIKLMVKKHVRKGKI